MSNHDHPHDHSHDHDHRHDHGHDHGHSMYDVDPTHSHPPQPDTEDVPLTRHQIMQIAVTELMIEKGVFTAEAMRKQIELMDSLSPVRGAMLVARAWVDDDFRNALIADTAKAAAQLDMDIGPIPIITMPNSESVHNLIVCTLCSCYPRMLLGIPPDWYKSREYRSRAVREPRAVLSEFGTTIGDDVEVRVHDSTADMRYLVLPNRPTGSEGLSEEALRDLVTRDCLIGVAVPKINA